MWQPGRCYGGQRVRATSISSSLEVRRTFPGLLIWLSLASAFDGRPRKGHIQIVLFYDIEEGLIYNQNPPIATVMRPRPELKFRAVIATSMALLVLAVWALLSIFPLYWNVVTAFLPVDRMFSYPPELFPRNPTFQNFSALHTDIPTLWWNILNSVILAVAIPLVTVFLGTLAGFAFAKLRFWGQEALFYATIATLAVPPLIGYIPLFLIMTKVGMGNTLWAVFFPSVIGAFAIFLFRQTMETIPEEIIDAARVDGASNFVIYRAVAVPLVRALVITELTVGFLAAFNDYFWPRIYSDPGRVHGGETARGGIHGVPLKSWTRTSRPFTPCLRAVCR